ncbi:hypothetical protein ABZ570_03960 [Micromonospora sp. NPDC007271]|uniref:hypothetical protein n=1 Tax=Micromonospora sp. NPDC007271 TaxID=3154587 RepID=UPI0033CA3702
MGTLDHGRRQRHVAERQVVPAPGSTIATTRLLSASPNRGAPAISDAKAWVPAPPTGARERDGPVG